jgi:hypothetical protein
MRRLGFVGLLGLALLVGPESRATAGNPGDLILNEFNGTGDLFFLRNGGTDTFFGTVQGNGGNWVELVVVADHLDIRGWKLEWANADPDSGSITFLNHSIWSDLRSGTIITIREDDLSPPGYGVLLSDLSYDPLNGDWWIHANVDDFNVVGQLGFKTDDDNWQMSILDDLSNVIQAPVGEATALWGGGGGVAGDEVGKLEQDPSAAAAMTPPVPMYNDGTSSTFGSPNRWDAGALLQDFCALRDPVLGNPACVPPVPALSVPGGTLLAGLIGVTTGLALKRRRR